MSVKNFNIKGLSTDEVAASRSKYGNNTTEYKNENILLKSIVNFLQDPMVILLLVASAIYFISGKISTRFPVLSCFSTRRARMASNVSAGSLS